MGDDGSAGGDDKKAIEGGAAGDDGKRAIEGGTPRGDDGSSDGDGKRAIEGGRAPRIAITRVYTRKGDRGATSLVGGQRVSKADRRIDAYGTLDELNAVVGQARFAVEAEVRTEGGAELSRALLRVQHELFNAGSLLATLPVDVHPLQPRVTPAAIDSLEADMDRRNVVLGALKSFVLPGGSASNAALHLARTVCRRAERVVVALAAESEVDPLIVGYLNRLSDAFFVWSRWANHELGVPETLWEPSAAR